jgi:hypothetical protein
MADSQPVLPRAAGGRRRKFRYFPSGSGRIDLK